MLNGQLEGVDGVPWFFDRLIDRNLILRSKDRSGEANALLNAAMGQILGSFEPGSVRFLIIDQARLGESFKAITALGDFDADLITGMIWSESSDIKRELLVILRNVASIRQNLLRGDHASIDEYNRAFEHRSGSADQPYRFIFIANFPEGFDAESCEILERIMINGAECGVHVFMSWPRSAKLPYGVEESIFDSQAAVHNVKDGIEPTAQASLTNVVDDAFSFIQLSADSPPSLGAISEVIHSHGSGVDQAKEVEYPFSAMMEAHADKDANDPGVGGRTWTWSSEDELVIPLGQAGANRLQYLKFGRDRTTTHHALVLGGTGSGKSNLLHVMIQALAESYSPDEVNLFLVDGKSGSEFNPYAKHGLPHTRVIGLDSDPEFSVSILGALMDEAEERNKIIFPDVETGSFSEYRDDPARKLPRIVAIFDEFQEMLLGSRAHVAEVQELLARIARKGRSSGVHLVLSTQTLKGIDLPEDLLTQIGARIVLINAEADWPKVLSNDNVGPRVLERGGQAIVNDQYGATKGNKRVQIARAIASTELREFLGRMRSTIDRHELQRQDIWGQTFVFDGSEPASLESSAGIGRLLMASGEAATKRHRRKVSLVVGEPIALRDFQELTLRRQSGSNALVLARSELHALGTVLAMIFSLVVNPRNPRTSIDIIDTGHEYCTESQTNFFQLLADGFPEQIFVHSGEDAESVLRRHACALAEIDPRSDQSRLLILFGIQRLRQIWYDEYAISSDDEPSAGSLLVKLLQRGPERGCHTVAWCDTQANLEKAVALEWREFALGVVEKLDTSTSLKLLDSEDAALISRENRLVAFDKNATETCLEVRRFAIPDAEWFDRTLRRTTQ